MACKLSTTSRRGFGLLEVTISAGLILLLLALQVLLIERGSSAWSKTDAQADLTQTLQVLLARIEREAQLSTPAGCTCNSAAITLISQRAPGQTSMQLSPAGQTEWKGYSVFFWSSTLQQVRLVSLSLPAASDSAKPVEQVDVGSGVQPFSFYQTGGQRLASWVDSFSVSLSGTQLSVSVSASHTRYGSSAPERVQLNQAVTLRN